MVDRQQNLYQVWLEPEVHAVRKRLPGNVRQRIKREIGNLATNPRPATSRGLDVAGLALPQGVEALRIRMERWRIVYAINDDEGWVWVLAVHPRPPYDYEDLPDLFSRLTE